MALPPELLDPRLAAYWVSVPLQAALALAALWLAPGDARHRAFAVLVSCNAAWDLSEALAFAGGGAHAGTYARAGHHFAVWTAFALAAFLLHYPVRRRLARPLVPALGLAAVGASALLLVDHGLYAEGESFGPLRLALLLWFPLLAVGALALLRDARAGSASRAFPRAIVAAALLVYPLGTLVAVAQPGFWTGLLPQVPAMLVDGARWPQALVVLGSLAATLAAPILAGWAVVVAARHSRHAAAYLALGLAGVAALDLVPGGLSAGATSLAFALLVTYALARAKLFDLDVRLRWGVSRASVVGAILGTAIVIGEVVAQQVVSDRLGVAAGAIAAALLFFVFAPLKRAAERLVARLLPGVGDDLEARKRDVYLAALEGAVADGIVTDRERQVLDRLGSKLGIDPAQMAAIEASLLERQD